ncbi:MAG: hypothetical protein HQM02_04285, partial [Magnetococcales bacterium]|nr:hypothetical protein [Magnetococcales bacterium]
MSLSSKLVWSAILVTGLFVGIAGLVQRFVIYPSFEQLDRIEAEKNGDRSLQALQRELHHLALMVQDWSVWDDTYRFIEDRNPEYMASNFVASTFTNINIDLLFMYDRSGGLVWGHRFDERKEAVPWPEFPANRAGHPLQVHLRQEMEGVKGVLLTDHGPILVAAFPILTSEHQGPARGTVIMGRMLDASLLKTLRDQTGVSFQIWEPGQEPTMAERAIKAGLMRAPSPGQVLHVEEGWIRFYALLRDVEARATLLLRADTPREIAVRGWNAIVIGVFFQCLAALLVMAVMMIFLKRMVLNPIASLTGSIARDGGRDEFDILAQYKSALERAIAEGTRELQVARDVALGASQAKGEFLSTMSHEIRTPMNVILGYSEILEKTPLNEEQQKFLTAIQSAGNSLLGLINDILDLAKVESGKLIVERIPFRLQELVDNCLLMFREAAHGKGLTLSGEIVPTIPDRLVGDRVRVRQILVNLLGNAIKFTSEGGVRVRVQEEVRSDRVVVVTFAVVDTGIGVPEEKLRSIFEAFTQADASDTRQYGGSGLGLAICVRMAEAMGGVVWAEN